MARGRANRTAQMRRPGKSVLKTSQADGTAITIARKVTVAASPIVENKVVFFPSVFIECLWFIENSSELWNGIPLFHFITAGLFLG